MELEIHANVAKSDLLKDTNLGYFVKNDDGFELRGFAGLTPKTKVNVFTTDEGIVVLEPDEDLPLEESILFDKLTLKNPMMVKYLDEYNAFGVLFLRIFGGTYVQCKNVFVKEVD